RHLAHVRNGEPGAGRGRHRCGRRLASRGRIIGDAAGARPDRPWRRRAGAALAGRADPVARGGLGHAGQGVRVFRGTRAQPSGALPDPPGAAAHFPQFPRHHEESGAAGSRTVRDVAAQGRRRRTGRLTRPDRAPISGQESKMATTLKGSGQKFIARNRAPRVQIEYDVEIYGAERKIQLPFVMGVMADLAGKSAEPQPDVSERKFMDIDIDNFDERMKSIQPRAAFQVPNTLTGEGNLNVDVTFESIDDFSPATVARKVGALNELLEARTQLANLLTY